MADLAKCPYCAADCGTDEAFCWMCHARLWQRPSSLPARPVRDLPIGEIVPPSEGPEYTPRPVLPPKAAKKGAADLKVSETALIGVLLATIAGAVYSPTATLRVYGLAVMLPALFVMGLSPASKPPEGRERTWDEKALAALGLLMKGAAIVALALIALAVALAATCSLLLAFLH